MSTDYIVYLSSTTLPSPHEWQSAIILSGDTLKIDTGIDLLTHSGFLPCELNKDITGFEYYSSFIDDDERQEINLPGVDFNILFSVGRNLTETVAAIIAIGGLIALTDGVIRDPQEGKYISSSDFINWKKQMLKLTFTNR